MKEKNSADVSGSLSAETSNFFRKGFACREENMRRWSVQQSSAPLRALVIRTMLRSYLRVMT